MYDKDPDFGDKVRITVIATGFELESIGGMTAENMGNIERISSDFEFSADPKSQVVEEENVTMKIGPNDTYNVCKFKFTEPPVLYGAAGAKIGELERTSAIKRIKTN